ncbi:hypothetical protein LPJ59_001568, partial [Coemansia sp. RSA 2399]
PEPSSIEGSSEAPSEHEVTSCVEETIATPATVSGLAPEVPAAETPMSSASLESKTPGPFVAATTIFIDVTTDIVVTEILTATGLPRPAVPTNSASTVPQLPEATTPPPVDVSIMERPTTISTSVDASSSATSTSSAPTSLAEACVPAAVSTVTVAIPVYLPFYPPFATEVWPNYSAIQPPFAPGPVIWTQGPIVPAPTEMHKAMGTSKGRKPTTATGAAFLKRIHDSETEEQSSGTKQQQPKYYQAAGEDDHMGWEIGDDRMDPMYTMNRREREQSARGKDAFFKKLKIRTAPSGEAEEGGGDIEAVEPRGPALGVMAFGFGMGGMIPAAEKTGTLEKSNKRKKKEKTKIK